MAGRSISADIHRDISEICAGRCSARPNAHTHSGRLQRVTMCMHMPGLLADMSHTNNTGAGKYRIFTRAGMRQRNLRMQICELIHLRSNRDFFGWRERYNKLLDNSGTQHTMQNQNNKKMKNEKRKMELG